MNKLRHDLMTSGWSMLDSHKWLVSINECWGQFKTDHIPAPMQGFRNEMDWLLHEALPDEHFYMERLEARVASNSSYWHIDGGYLRVLFTCCGRGTIAALGFKNNVETPLGYALIMTGQQRTWKTGILETWHTAPEYHSPRRIIVLNFRNGE